MTKQDLRRLTSISQIIFDKKGFNILVLDIRGVSSMADYFIIAEGSVGRHVKSLATSIKGLMHDEQMAIYHCEGENDGEWVVMDCGEIMIHLMVPDMREKYALEELYKKGKIVDVHIVVT